MFKLWSRQEDNEGLESSQIQCGIKALQTNTTFMLDSDKLTDDC